MTDDEFAEFVDSYPDHFIEMTAEGGDFDDAAGLFSDGRAKRTHSRRAALSRCRLDRERAGP